MIPNYTDLQYFLEVAKLQHLSSAAKRIGISQPSLSEAIQRLEKCLGVSLFIRTRKGMTPTQAGFTLLSNIRTLTQNWEDIRHRVTRSQIEVTGTYKLGCHTEVGIDSLPLFMPDLLEEYPELKIQLIHDLSRKILEAVISLEIDLGIVVNPTPHPDLVLHKLSYDEVGLWVGPGRRKVQTIDGGEAVLIGDPDLLQVQKLIKQFKKNGIQFKRFIPSSDLEVVTALVAAGAGVGMLPSEVALRNPSFKLKKIKEVPGIKDTVCFAYRIENKKVRSIALISERIISSHEKKYGRLFR